MTRAEWFELSAIAVIAAAGWPAASNFPPTIPLWQVVLALSALLLAQSLVRDFVILFLRRRSNQPGKTVQCFCLESTVGTAGVLAGAILAALSRLTQITFNRVEWFLALTATLATGFLIKDWVISWKPFGFRREKDHLNLIVRWKGR